MQEGRRVSKDTENGSNVLHREQHDVTGLNQGIWSDQGKPLIGVRGLVVDRGVFFCTLYMTVKRINERERVHFFCLFLAIPH